MKFSDYNSLEYGLLSWYLYLDDKKCKGIWQSLTQRPNFIPSCIFERDFENMLNCKDSSEIFKQIGFCLIETGKVILKQPDKYGNSYIYDIDKIKRIKFNALQDS